MRLSSRFSRWLSLIVMICCASYLTSVAAAVTTHDAIPNLPRRAFELETHGAHLSSLKLLLKEIHERVQANNWSDELLVAETVIAAIQMEKVTVQLEAWEETAAALAANKPYPPSTPPQLAASLDQTLAKGLRLLGHVAEALALTVSNGSITDWQIIGPFANERDTGYDTKLAPEETIDLTKSVRGKERDVTWRANPVPIQRGLDLNALLRPNTQAIAFLATAVYVEKPHDLVLSVASTGAIKVFLNETQVFGRKVQRPYSVDQDRVVLPLNSGWNRILVKLGVGDKSQWLFSARLLELDGRPCTIAQVDSSHIADRVPVAIVSNSHAAATASEILASHPENAEAMRMLAMYHLAVHPDDHADRSAKVWAERAAAIQPDDVQGLYLLATANAPEAGADQTESQVNSRLIPLKEVLARDSRHVAAILDLADFAMRENPTPQRADELTARALALAPTNLRALEARMSFLQWRYRTTEARLLGEFADETDEGRLAAWSTSRKAYRQSIQLGDIDASRATLCDGIAHGKMHGLFETLRREYTSRGDIDAALALTDKYLEIFPFAVDQMLTTADAVEHAGRLDEARALITRALHICPESTQAHFALGRLAQRQNDIATADKELAEVVRLDPGYDKARRQRQVIAATHQNRFEDPYRWDAIERIGDAEQNNAENERVVLLDRTTVWRTNSDGTEHHYEHFLYRVQNLGGVNDFDRYPLWCPTDSTMQVYNVRVIHTDKSFIRAPAPSRSSEGTYDLPPLQIGDCIDIEYRIDQSNPDLFGQYFGLRHEFYADFPDQFTPTRRCELVVISPPDLPIYTTERNATALDKFTETDMDGNSVHRWVAHDLKRPARESAMPQRSEFAPVVDVTTFANWQAFATWWWGLIEKEFVTSPAMKDKVRELTAGLTDETDKVRAIARFVGQEIRYNSWPFGTHGYQPFSAATIFERRFGDCKDKSILLRQMLAEIGVEAHPVLINAEYYRKLEPLDSAMVGQFNHCIAYLPATSRRTGYYLDATSDRAPIEYLRADDQGARVLHVHDGKGEIHEIPYAAPRDNSLVREYDITLSANGTGEVRLVDTSNGGLGVQLRYYLGGEKGDLNLRLSQMLADEFGKVDIAQVTTSALEDIGVPVKLNATVQVKGLLNQDGAGMNLRLSFDPIPILEVANEPPEERVSDLVLDRPFAMRTRVLYRLPESAKVKTLPPDATIVTPGMIEYHMVVRKTPDGIEVLRDFQLLERRISKSQYGDFRNALREIQLAEQRTIVLNVPPPIDDAGARPATKLEEKQ